MPPACRHAAMRPLAHSPTRSLARSLALRTFFPQALLRLPLPSFQYVTAASLFSLCFFPLVVPVWRPRALRVGAFVSFLSSATANGGAGRADRSSELPTRAPRALHPARSQPHQPWPAPSRRRASRPAASAFRLRRRLISPFLAGESAWRPATTPAPRARPLPPRFAGRRASSSPPRRRASRRPRRAA